MKADLDEPAKPKPGGSTKKAEGDHSKRGAGAAGDEPAAGEDGDGWPLDLNNSAFLKGDRDTQTTLTWGTDPDGVASPKAR